MFRVGLVLPESTRCAFGGWCLPDDAFGCTAVQLGLLAVVPMPIKAASARITFDLVRTRPVILTRIWSTIVYVRSACSATPSCLTTASKAVDTGAAGEEVKTGDLRRACAVIGASLTSTFVDVNVRSARSAAPSGNAVAFEAVDTVCARAVI